jgi:hypothetical protein
MLTNWQLSIKQFHFVVTASAPPSTGVLGSMVLLTADAWNSSWRATKFLESLKNREVDREGIPFPPLLLQSSDTFIDS